MYTMYFKTKGWRHEVTDSSEASKGYKELVMKVEGEGVCGTLLCVFVINCFAPFLPLRHFTGVS